MGVYEGEVRARVWWVSMRVTLTAVVVAKSSKGSSGGRDTGRTYVCACG